MANVVTTPPPICACCRGPLDGPWALTEPAVYLICGAAGCEHWAAAQGLRVYVWGAEKKPAPPVAYRRAKTNCDCCGGQLPRRRDQFRDGTRAYCSLTCNEEGPAAQGKVGRRGR